MRSRRSLVRCSRALHGTGSHPALAGIASVLRTALVIVGFGFWATAFSQERSPHLPSPSKAPRSLVSPYKTLANPSDETAPSETVQTAGAVHEDPEAPVKKVAPQTSEPEINLEETPIPEYPPDPAWPTWTPASDPLRQQIFAPAGFYDLVHPPQGISPQEDGQEYGRIVAGDEDLLFHQATCPPPIDLFRPDGIAPAGVFGDHTLNTGGRLMVSYRFQNMGFSGLRDGTHSVSTSSVLGTFPLAPTHMTAQQHVFVLEYGPTDDLTLQVIAPIISRRIDFVDRSGNTLVTDQTDPSDIQLNALYVLSRWDRQQIHLNVGVKAPLGIFDPLGQFPTPTSPDLTYPMRTSDGTWDFLPGITYRGQSDYWTWGVQALGNVRLGINRYAYKLGDEANLNGWISRKLTDSMSASLRLNGYFIGNIYGADRRLNADLVPTNRTNLQAGQLLNVLFGLNYVFPTGLLRGQRFGVEGGLPAYQSLSGPQLQQRYQIWTSLIFTF